MSAEDGLLSSSRRAAAVEAAGADVRTRGRLVLAEKVVTKVAGQAVVEIGAAQRKSGGLFGIGIGIGAGSEHLTRPKVEVQLFADSADLAVVVGIGYPGSIRQTTEAVREHVTTRVQELTGVAVRRVDVDVTFLAVSSGLAPTKRVLR